MMSLTLPRLTAIAVTFVLVACGGGGGDDSSPAPQSYITQGGLQWSATTAKELTLGGSLSNPNPSVPFDQTASYYCSGQTCDAGGRNCRATNFNGELGWKLPTPAQLRSLYASRVPLTGWTLGETLANDGNTAVNLATGKETFYSGNNYYGKVTCVKPL